jgi:hypothetical protein
MEKIFKWTSPQGIGGFHATAVGLSDLYLKHGWHIQEGFFLPKEEKPKYLYYVVDSNGTSLAKYSSRENARSFKRSAEKYPFGGEVPPYKIVRYQLVNPTHIR